MKELFGSLPEEAQNKLRKREQPDWMDPMLATLTDRRFSDEDWIFERKLDGERCLVFRKEEEVRLMSRNQQRLNSTYPELVDSFEQQPVDSFIVDGEMVAFEGDLTSFSRLQERMHLEDPEEARQSDVTVYCYLFDLLYLDGYDITQAGLRHRKKLLKSAISFEDPLRFTVHRNKEGKNYYQEACKKGWEGVIAKKADSKYVHSRSKHWLKFKCVNQQEFVIGGYTDPEGERIGFGALLIGYYDGEDLIYAGKVGTGYSNELLQRLSDRMSSLKQKTSPFSNEDLPEKGVHWVEPNLVGEVAFTEWTEEGKLRHPRFKGLRSDKEPGDVIREKPEA
ncbi:MAG: non-homologous end-joining DNA ligase [Thermoproteota archaeon]